jgi:Ca2+-binding RTX toxin-like protein
VTRRLRWWPLAILVLVLTVASTAQTSANTVPGTKMKNDTRTIGAEDLKPVECASITLTAKVTGSGTITGGAAAELITGSAGVDTISGSGGNDCLLGGAGNDSLNGGAGTDVCVGGLGTDTFNASCETQIQ